VEAEAPAEIGIVTAREKEGLAEQMEPATDGQVPNEAAPDKQ